jgi:predicted lipoprotein with Yx(FWY)xxD motif
MRSRFLIVATLAMTAVVAACSSSGASSPPASQAPASVAPASQAPASEAPASGSPAASAAAGGLTVDAKPVGTVGTVLVASNGMTLYTFTDDVKDSGKSACTGQCIATWPALTVPAGGTPTGGTAVTGTLGTITREDDGTLQVTYNGLPLYFFANDKAPGDANGVYEKWEVVKP